MWDTIALRCPSCQCLWQRKGMRSMRYTSSTMGWVRTMRIAPNGHRTAHKAHPVQAAASCS